MGKSSFRWSKDSANRMKYKFGNYTEFSLHLFMYFQLFQLLSRSFQSSFWVDELFLLWACQNKMFYLIGGSRRACLSANAERNLEPGTRGNPRPEVPHYMRRGYLIMLCFQAFYLSFLQHFPWSLSKKFHLIHKNSMSTFTGLVRLFSRRTARVLSSKNVANTFQSSCRARSIFAATTRGASQNLRYAIPCACTKVFACEVHKYTQGWFYNNFCGVCSYFPRNHGALFCSLNSRRMLSRLTWEKMDVGGLDR